VQELRSDEVRWFYKSSKKKIWKPFVGYDSIQIETAWRMAQNGTEVPPICVRGGFFEVDVVKKEIFPVYWSADHGDSVFRGTWFFQDGWAPLEEIMADTIEQEHVARWKGYSIEEVQSLMENNTVMHRRQLDKCHVEWTSITDVTLYKDATAHRALRNIGQKIGVSKVTTSGYRLHRGYKEDAFMEDKSQPVTNLTLVIHGIGAKSDRAKIVRNTSAFRSLCRQIETSHKLGGRSEFIPVEWRSKSKLDENLVETITPKKGQHMRRFIHNTALDVMYYTSPLYRKEIVESLKHELNKLYNMFMERNENFNGKVSILAHSLGNIIFHDVLSNWAPTKEGELSNPTHTTPHSPSPLSFQTDTIFSAGSPLGMFLCMRGYHPDKYNPTIPIIPSPVRRMFNIFHPADPVAYRIEPLILPHYSKIDTLQVPSYAEVSKSYTLPSSSTAVTHPSNNHN